MYVLAGHGQYQGSLQCNGPSDSQARHLNLSPRPCCTMSAFWNLPQHLKHVTTNMASSNCCSRVCWHTVSSARQSRHFSWAIPNGKSLWH